MLPSEVKEKESGKKKKDVPSFPWTREQEELLAEWAEKSMCYRWLHGRSEKSYRIRNYSFTIPVIILSTLTGTANFAMDSFVPEEHKQLAMAGVGSVNIFAGILSTLQNFLRYAELMESHRLSEVQWSKFGRNIEVELALDPLRRKPAHEFLEVCRAEYDRLIEQSPTIDDAIIKQFKKTFKKIEIMVPPMCNGLHKVKIFEPTKEAKLEAVLTNVTGNLLSKKKHRKWTVDDIPTNSGNSGEPELSFAQSPNQDAIDAQRNETKKDLDELMSFSRVSSLKRGSRTPAPAPVAGEDEEDDPEKQKILAVKAELQEVIASVQERPPTSEESEGATEATEESNEAEGDIENPNQGEDDGASFLQGIEDP